jgi:hypothetical protein
MANDAPDSRPENELNINFEALASSEAAGCATPEELATLRAAPTEWAATLRRLLAETEAAIPAARRITGPERDMVVADFTDERDRLRRSLSRLVGDVKPAPRGQSERRSAGERRPAEAERRSAPERSGEGRPADDDRSRLPPSPPALQASWQDGRIVLWAGSASVPRPPAEERDRLMAEAGAGSISWEPHSGVPVPGGGRAAAVSAPVTEALGWLVGVGTGQLAPAAAPSLRWLGEVAAWATELVARGQMIPTLVGPAAGARSGRPSTAEHRVRWVPALVDADRLRSLSARMPGAVGAAEQPRSRPTQMCRSVLGAAVDAVCRAGAARLVTAATVPVARSRSEVREAVLAGLDGTPFAAAVRPGAELADELARWTAPVTGDRTVILTVPAASPACAR